MKWSKQKEKNYHNLQWVSEEGLIRFIEDICGHGDDFLDLGCGTGVLIDRISSHYGRSVGVDPSESLLARAPKRDGIEYIQKPLEKINYEGEFDTVLMRNTLHHVKDPEIAMAVAHRALKPGGMLVVCEGVPPDSKVTGFYKKLFALFDKRHIFNEGDLISMFRMAGFRGILVEPYFMENVNLEDWLEKVSPDDDIYCQAMSLHVDGNTHFKAAYEVSESSGPWTMTWRFSVVSGTK